MVKRVDTADLPFTDHVLDAIGEIFFVFTAEGQILQWNRRVNEVTGYSDEEIARMHPVEFVADEDVDVVRRHIAKVLEEGRTQLEARYRTKDGRLVPYEFTGSLLEHEGQKLICGTGRDIAEKKEAEEALRKSERRYRRLFEEAQEGIAISTPEGEIVDVNPAVQRILGYSREELLEMNATELYADPKERREGRMLLAKDGVVRDFEARVRRKDGEEIVCQLSSTVHHGAEGEIGAFQTFIRDVTERKEAEEALRASEERYRRLFEESRDAVILTTPAGEIVDVNGAAEELFGYSRDEFLRLDAGELYADLAERERRILPKLMRSTSSRVLEAEMRHKEGYTFLASASVTVHRDEEGRPILIQALVRDITDQRRLQREVLRVQEEERRRLGQDLHDGVASQLTGVAIMLGTLSRQAAEHEELAAHIQEAQELVQESCQDIRRLSRGLSPAGLSEDGLPSALRRLAENTEGGVFEEDTEELSELEGDVAAHLYWIAQEATTNARKYAEAGEIAIRLVRENDALALAVEDDGTGFDLEGVEEEGMGLRTMRYRAELVGGALTIDSSPGRGTCVTCRLPMEDPS